MAREQPATGCTQTVSTETQLTMDVWGVQHRILDDLLQQQEPCLSCCNCIHHIISALAAPQICYASHACNGQPKEVGTAQVSPETRLCKFARTPERQHVAVRLVQAAKCATCMTRFETGNVIAKSDPCPAIHKDAYAKLTQAQGGHKGLCYPVPMPTPGN